MTVDSWGSCSDLRSPPLAKPSGTPEGRHGVDEGHEHTWQSREQRGVRGWHVEPRSSWRLKVGLELERGSEARDVIRQRNEIGSAHTRHW
jgi:hypothetical protein